MGMTYSVKALTASGEQIDLTDVCEGLGWSEGARELSAKITLKLAAVEGLSGKIEAFTPIYIYADGEEVIRGNVQKWSVRESSGEYTLTVEAADEVQALRKNQDEFYFTDGHTTTAILSEILTKWGVPFELQVQDVTHSKKVYRRKYLIDMISDVLKDVKEKDGGVYFVRAKGGVIQILPRGTNEVTYHFDVSENVTRLGDYFDVSGIVTRVLVVAKSKAEGHQAIESTVEGKTELGIRQIIYERGDKESLEEAEVAARRILTEQGNVKRETTIESPDVPMLRKGDRIRVRSSLGEGYFFVKGIRHNAATGKMTVELDEDKERSAAYDTNATDESGSSTPP